MEKLIKRIMNDHKDQNILLLEKGIKFFPNIYFDKKGTPYGKVAFDKIEEDLKNKGENFKFKPDNRSTNQKFEDPYLIFKYLMKLKMKTKKLQIIKKYPLTL